jgi:3-phytase
MKLFRSPLIIPFLAYALTCTGCQNRSETGSGVGSMADTLQMQDLEARQDSIELAAALSAQAAIRLKVTADVETEPVASAEEEDAADDPAIWYNEQDPARSLILGTDKKAGIYVYDLDGRILQFRNVGRINNVDLRDGFIFHDKEVVLVAGSNRSNNCITLFCIDRESRELSDSLVNIKSGVDEVYGLCLYKSQPGGEFYVFVNGKGGMLEQWIVTDMDKSGVKKLRSFMLSSQPEGMVASDRNAVVYLGVEHEGIFKLDADPRGDTSLYRLPGSDSSNVNITYDIEGLALFSYRDEDYLIASIQGSFSFAIFRLGDPESYLTSFTITDGQVDGVEETDGIEITTEALSDRFREGIFVAQDGFNTDAGSASSQNFKYVSFSKIAKILDELRKP